MAIGVMDTKPQSPPPAADPSVAQIIAAARAKQQPAVSQPGAAAAWVLSSLTAVLLWATFTPVDCGPLAWIALVPLLILVRIPQPTKWMYRILFITALVNQIATLQWMRLGDPTMYLALMALATYIACYIPVFVALARFAHHRWSVPLVIAVPVLWTGLEYAKAYLFTGFSWYYLGHSQYRWLELIQVSDLVGAYGVSFLVAMANAAIAGLIPSRWLLKLRLIGPEAALLQAAVPFRSALTPVVATLAVFAAVLGYGVMRRHQADFQPGPRVALIQGDFVASLREPPHDQQKILLTHLRLTGLAVREQPDLVVWPEGMYPYILLEAAPEMTDEQLRRATPGADADPKIWRENFVKGELARESQRAGAALLWGIHAVRAEPGGIRQLNSAVFVTPEQGVVGRYDKQHLVIFGEYIPFKSIMPWIQGVTPYTGDMGLTAGRTADGVRLQRLAVLPGDLLRRHRAATRPVCRGERLERRDPQAGRCARQHLERRLVPRLERIGPTPDHGGVPGRGMPDADCPRRQHGHLGGGRRRRGDSRAGDVHRRRLADGFGPAAAEIEPRSEDRPLASAVERGDRPHRTVGQSPQRIRDVRRLVRRRLRSVRRRDDVDGRSPSVRWSPAFRLFRTG